MAEKNGLEAVLKIQRQAEENGKKGPNLCRYLDVRDAAALSRVSKDCNKEVQKNSILPELHGRRTVDVNPSEPAEREHFWSKEPASADKRYFKPISHAGKNAEFTSAVPHISEQKGHAPHLTDIASCRWSAPNKKLPTGDYPTKVQFPLIGSSSGPRQLGPENLPVSPQKGRVLTAHPMPTQKNVYIETKSLNKAIKDKGLPPSYPHTLLTSEQANKPITDVMSKWKGKTVTGKDR